MVGERYTQWYFNSRHVEAHLDIMEQQFCSFILFI